MLDCAENATVTCILIPFFLHMYYSIKQKRITSTLLLRESLTLCELLDLDKEFVYVTLPGAQNFRRCFFCGNAMQNDLVTVLGNSIELPKPKMTTTQLC